MTAPGASETLRFNRRSRFKAAIRNVRFRTGAEHPKRMCLSTLTWEGPIAGWKNGASNRTLNGPIFRRRHWRQRGEPRPRGGSQSNSSPCGDDVVEIAI